MRVIWPIYGAAAHTNDVQGLMNVPVCMALYAGRQPWQSTRPKGESAVARAPTLPRYQMIYLYPGHVRTSCFAMSHLQVGPCKYCFVLFCRFTLGVYLPTLYAGWT